MWSLPAYPCPCVSAQSVWGRPQSRTGWCRVFLHKIKKVKTPICAGCNSKDEDLSHLLLHCRFYDPIREKYLSQYFVQNTSIGDILGNEDMIIQTILDPISAKLPDTVRNSWLSVKDAYKLSRQFCYDLHRKIEKLYSLIRLIIKYIHPLHLVNGLNKVRCGCRTIHLGYGYLIWLLGAIHKSCDQQRWGGGCGVGNQMTRREEEGVRQMIIGSCSWMCVVGYTRIFYIELIPLLWSKCDGWC